MIDDLLGRSSWGLILAASHADGREALIAVVFAILGALLAWLLFHFVAPAYEAVAAIVTFIVLILVLLLL